jgi:hypothetical protein
MEVDKLETLGRSEIRGGGRILSPVMNVYFQLHVHCVTYHSSDYRTERVVHSITVVLHVVKYILLQVYFTLLFIM